jgi:hypothetical protein
MCVFMVRSRVKTEGGSEVEAAIEKAFPAIAEAQPLDKEGENSLLAISAFQRFQAALKVRLAEVPVLERRQSSDPTGCSDRPEATRRPPARVQRRGG